MTTHVSEFWIDRNVFVTGCTGLLGSWLTEVLVEAGANVVGLVRDSVPRSRLFQSNLATQINVVHGQVENYQLLERVLNEYEVETVFHLAAQTIVSIANENPLSTFDANIRGTWQLLEACRRSPLVKGVVVASSDKAYGEQADLPYSEDTPLSGSHPYDVSKACADILAQSYAKSYGLPVSITRFGNLFGPGDANFNRLIPGTVRSIIRGEAPVIRSDGKFSRDYIFVEDAAHAYTLMGEAVTQNPSNQGKAFNFSYESPLTALDVVEKISAIMERTDLKPRIQNTARNEIPHQYLSANKARKVLGWQPMFDFDEGLRRTIPWYINLLGK